jgi:TPR repeat protein
MIPAEQRSSITQFELGQMFRKAPPDQRDYAQAAAWFARSARQGFRDAQYMTGLMHARGLGVERDPVEAYAWLKIAAAQGSRKALRCLIRLQRQMSWQQLQLGRERSKRYYLAFVENAD